MIYWFFGYPGVGKDYCARQLARIGKFPHINADDFLTDEDKKKLLAGTFTINDRIKKLERIISHLQVLLQTNKDIAIGDSLPENASREFVIESFKNNIKLILVTAPQKIHKKRISNRKNHFFTEELLENYIARNWEEVRVEYKEFQNDGGKTFERLKTLLSDVTGL